MARSQGMTSRDFYARIASNIARSRRHLMAVLDQPPFCYSISNSLRHLPELLVIGLAGNDAAWVINHFSDLMIERGREFGDREIVDCGGAVPIMAVHCIPGVKITRTIQAGRFFGHEDYRVTQIVIPDKAGRFPGDPLCVEPYSSTPVFGRSS